ncbi:cytochrome c3 family protein [Paraliomyxa miuraensis]|uniref:cytochrome c3 family protein n=1 Tax=Paraliomyxa miuraensis TaxID=376150 RepID=UPI00224F0934|nr:cytochrome c3 family protein [Paraliomyxa miuraensis]MCX4244495.1 cytochrome C [Paraliomyxa miuraensis]
MTRNLVLWVLGLGLLFVAALCRDPLAQGAPTRGGPSRTATVGDGGKARARAEVPTTAAVMVGPVRRGSPVYPEQEIPLRFNHGQHLALGIDCSRCHTDVATSTRSRDLNFPRGESCDECHGPQHPRPRGEPARCALCHTEVDADNRVTAGLRAPRPQLVFNHQMHAQFKGQRGSDCEDCHGDMSKVRLATTLQLPREADCLTCHDGFQATERCGACHPTEASGRLATRAQDDRVLPALIPTGRSGWGAAHDLNFVEDHAGISKANPTLCQSCHDESFCLDCHAGALRPLRIHAGDYVTAHALDARARTQDCQSCHRTQTFCLGCHERMGFGEREEGAFGVGGGLRFHPDGWSGPPGMPQGHAHAAQRNIGACVSCHTEDSCLACHATTGVAAAGLDVSPHGPGFGRSPRCRALASRARRACLKCHAPVDPHLECG